MSFFRYPGGKAKLRSQITRNLILIANSRQLEYREVFVGGGSIGSEFMANSDVKNIWINDKDIGIACLWTSVIRYPYELKKLVQQFTPTVNDFYKMQKVLLEIDTMPKTKNKIVDIGFQKLAIHQTSYSGLGTKSGGPLGGVKQLSAYKIDCRWSPKYICQKIDKTHMKFSGVKIRMDACTNLDFADVIKDDEADALLYLDPPYYDKGNALYQHGFTLQDHVRLAAALQKTKHSWLLSYDDCPEVRKLYKWAHVRSIDVNYSITATKDKETGQRISTVKPELLIKRLV